MEPFLLLRVSDTMAEFSLIDVSVVIISWNTADLLKQCLQSVFSETLNIDFEVVVVDNASSDRSAEMVAQEFPEVILIANTKNLGFAAANNQGIETARGRYVLLLNSDTIVLDGAIQRTVGYADKHTDVAVVGCRVLNPDQTLQHSCFMFPSLLNWFLSASYLYKIFPSSRFFGRERMTWWSREEERDVEVVTGCFMLVRREAIADVGVMDDGFFMYAEETDWCYRFRAKGWKNRFMPDAQIVHIGGASAAKLGTRRAQISNASFVRYMFKHWSRPRALVGIFMLLFFYTVRLMVLFPARLVYTSVKNKQMLDNHWAGFKDILQHRHYRHR
jgi:GT2 family glycosyltransferase